MKRFFSLIFIIACFAINQAVVDASEHVITTNPKLQAAVRVLAEHNQNDVIAILNGQNATGKPIRVMFRDLTIYGLRNCEAATLKTRNGGVIILIDKKNENAPSEAIACLIAHESQHSPLAGTVQEELRAWLKEISTWNAIVRTNGNIVYSKDHLVKRLNYISRLYTNENGGDRIKTLITSHPTYAKLN